jgi:hypothetical protein
MIAGRMKKTPNIPITKRTPAKNQKREEWVEPLNQDILSAPVTSCTPKLPCTGSRPRFPKAELRARLLRSTASV